MIKASVSGTARALVQRTQQEFAQFPFYQLDDSSLISISVLDRFSLWLRGRNNWLDADRYFVHAIACYIAAMAHDLWLPAYGEGVLVDELRGEVFIRITGGEYLAAGQQVTIYIERELVTLLQQPQAEVPVLDAFSRTLNFDGPRLSAFALGVLLGPSPYVDGAWSMQPLDYFAAAIKKIVSKLAGQQAAAYARLFPDDAIGADSELYRIGKLIYPPTLMKEPYPAHDSAMAVLDYAQQRGYQLVDLLPFARNCCLLADERMQLTGLSLLAVANEALPVSAVALSESLSMFAPLIRSTVIALRSRLGMLDDWLAAESLDDSTVIDQLRTEQQLNMLPFLKLSQRFIKSSGAKTEIREVIALLVFMRIKEAQTLIQKLVEEDPRLLELRLQALWLESLSAKYQQTEKRIRSLLTEPQADQMPGVYALWARCYAMQGLFADAQRRMRGAYSLVSQGHESFAEYSQHYAMALQSMQQYDEALEVLDRCSDVGATPICYWTTKITLQRALGKSDAAAESLEQLRAIAPYTMSLMRELLFPHLSADTIGRPLN